MQNNFLSVFWADTTPPSYIDSQVAKLEATVAQMRALMPDSGVYLNECAFSEPDWQQVRTTRPAAGARPSLTKAWLAAPMGRAVPAAAGDQAAAGPAGHLPVPPLRRQRGPRLAVRLFECTGFAGFALPSSPTAYRSEHTGPRLPF